MPYSTKKTDDALIVELSGALTIRHAQALSKSISSSLENATAVYVEAEKVEDIDASILQVLCSLKKSVRTFAFKSDAKVVVSMIDRCALRRELLTPAKG